VNFENLPLYRFFQVAPCAGSSGVAGYEALTCDGEVTDRRGMSGVRPDANPMTRRTKVMSTVVIEMGMSLDGFIAAPGDDIGPVLDSWIDPPSGAMSEATQAIVESWFTTSAVVMGRRMFDLGAAQSGWVKNPPYAAPIFVVSHNIPDEIAAGGTNYTFVTDGVASAIKQAQEAAGDGFVTIAGGANVFQQALEARLVDELHLHFAPIVLGEGIRLFDNLSTLPVKLEVGKVVATSDVTHVTYRVLNK
jgi:dihydrofolate reductase